MNEETNEVVNIEHEDVAEQKSETQTAGTNDAHSVAYMQLMSDPDIRKVIDAKIKGQSVEVSTPPVAGADDPDLSDPTPDMAALLKDLPEDDPARKVVEKAVAAATSVVSSQQKVIKELSKRLASVETVAGEVQKREVTTQVTNAREKFKDLDNYTKDMLKLSNEHPGLNVEELYLLAKNRSGKLKLQEGSTFSEKPSGQPQRDSSKPRTRKTPLPPGRRGFDQLLAESLQGLELNPE